VADLYHTFGSFRVAASIRDEESVNEQKSDLGEGRQAPVPRTTPFLIAEAPESLITSDAAKVVYEPFGQPSIDAIAGKMGSNTFSSSSQAVGPMRAAAEFLGKLGSQGRCIHVRRVQIEHTYCVSGRHQLGGALLRAKTVNTAHEIDRSIFRVRRSKAQEA
jgi:hypothetical protein